MNRRHFIQLLGLAGLSSLVPYGFSAWGKQPETALPIPGLLRPGSDGVIRLATQKGRTRWGGVSATTFGYNGPFLGPAILLERGQKVSFEVTNNLNEETTVHWHGLEIPGTADGGPQEPIVPGQTWKPAIIINQPAATCWYHPHPHGKTGRQVAMGLAGLLLIDDTESRKLPLPRTWGSDDIPVILQDKRFDSSGQIDYKLDVVSAAVGWFGNAMLTNGVVCPLHRPPRGWLRLRLLNGCNARSLLLAAKDRRTLYVIAGDGGLLSAPAPVTELRMFPGERFEVLVDLRDGKELDLLSLPVKQMGMGLPPFDAPLPILRLWPSQEKTKTTLPETLISLPALPPLGDLPTRTLTLSMDMRLDHQGMRELVRRYGENAMSGMEMGSMMGQGGGMMGQGNRSMGGMDRPPGDAGSFDLMRANYINGQAFRMDAPLFAVTQGRHERWIISGQGDMMLHPFHIHGTRFRILSENGADVPAHRAGYKDIVHVEGGRSEVLVFFPQTAPKEHMYMAHCHLLEHEDTGMMAGFTVAP